MREHWISRLPPKLLTGGEVAKLSLPLHAVMAIGAVVTLTLAATAAAAEPAGNPDLSALDKSDRYVVLHKALDRLDRVAEGQPGFGSVAFTSKFDGVVLYWK